MLAFSTLSTTQARNGHLQARDNVMALPWVKTLDLKMDARPPQPLLPDDSRPNGLRSVAHVIAVSSCKGGACACRCGAAATTAAAGRRFSCRPSLTPSCGRAWRCLSAAYFGSLPVPLTWSAGVGKSTTAVNLAYTLAQMGAKVRRAFCSARLSGGSHCPACAAWPRLLAKAPTHLPLPLSLLPLSVFPGGHL